MTRTSRLPEEPRFADRSGMAAGDTATARDAPATDVRPGLSGAAALNIETPGGFGDLRHSLTIRWMVQQR